jgi:hypothetical protein
VTFSALDDRTKQRVTYLRNVSDTRYVHQSLPASLEAMYSQWTPSPSPRRRPESFYELEPERPREPPPLRLVSDEDVPWEGFLIRAEFRLNRLLAFLAGLRRRR